MSGPEFGEAARVQGANGLEGSKALPQGRVRLSGGPKGWLVRSGIRTHASRGDCDLNAAP